MPLSRERRIDRAVEEFLTAWLVESRPEVAVGYLSPEAFECLALAPGEADPFDYGMAPYRYWIALQTVNDTLGPATSLEGVTVGVRWNYPGLTLVRHDAQARFVIFGVPDELAARWTCASLAQPGRRTPDPDIEPGTDFEDFNYFLSTFYIEGMPAHTGELALLWGREDGYWKVISYENDPDPTDEGSLPDIREIADRAAPERTTGNPALTRAVGRFTEDWLVQRDVESAGQFFSDRILPCVDLYHDPAEPALRTDADRTARLPGTRARTRMAGTTRPRSGSRPSEARPWASRSSGSRRTAPGGSSP